MLNLEMYKGFSTTACIVRDGEMRCVGENKYGKRPP